MPLARRHVRSSDAIASLPPREQFIKARENYASQSAFTANENKKYSVQDRNFIRGLQVTRGCGKTRAIRVFREGKKNPASMISLSDDVSKAYEQGITYAPPPPYGGGGVIKVPPKKVVPEVGAPKGRKYKYAGVATIASKERLARFKSLGGTARRYKDLETGETISRRERDKRLVL